MRHAPPAWGSQEDFLGRYTVRKGLSVTGGRNLDELHHRLERIMVRWRKEDVLPDLPPLLEPRIVRLPLTPPQRCLYDSLRSGALAEGLKTSAPLGLQGHSALAQLTRFRRLTSMSPKRFSGQGSTVSAKGEWIKNFLLYMLDEEDSAIVLTNWVDTARELGDLLADLHPQVVTGESGLEARKSAVETFGKVFIGSPAAFEGINLQHANVAIWVDLPWNSTQVIQGTGRIHRIGQTKTCQAYYLLAEDTIDTKVFDLVRGKARDIAQAIDGGITEELLQFQLSQVI
jgi:SNF2 family DNA or RNA helicase